MKKNWGRKIGLVNEIVDKHSLSSGSDSIMQRAVEQAFLDLTKKYNEFCFSGWGESLNEHELAVIENRSPHLDNILKDLLNELTIYKTYVSNKILTDMKKLLKI